MKSLWILSLLTLCGCSTYNNKFDCPYGNGVGCGSVSLVNRMIDRQEIEVDDNAKKRYVHVYYGPSRLSQLLDIETK